jgi:hypothetical protein
MAAAAHPGQPHTFHTRQGNTRLESLEARADAPNHLLPSSKPCLLTRALGKSDGQKEPTYSYLLPAWPWGPSAAAPKLANPSFDSRNITQREPLRPPPAPQRLIRRSEAQWAVCFRVVRGHHTVGPSERLLIVRLVVFYRRALGGDGEMGGWEVVLSRG